MFNTALNNGSAEKTGTIKAWGGTVAPSGWLICDGSEISRTLYAALFDVIGTTYGAGDGSTTFNIPNGKMAIGSAPVKGTGKTLGLYNGTNNGGFFFDGSNNATSRQNLYNVNAGASASGSNLGTGGVGVTKDGSKSGIVADLSSATSAANAIIKY